MTLLIGIRCADDSVVIASESAATYGYMGQETVSQQTGKIEIIDGQVLLAVSGPVGLGQLFKGELVKTWASGRLRTVLAWEAAPVISSLFVPHIKSAMETAQMAMPVIGHVAAASSAVSSTLVALPIYKEKTATLFQFNQQGAAEEATANLPWVALGSGQPLADPFIAFLRDVFWPTGPPALPDAVFSAVWAIKQCVAVAPGGIGGAVHVCTLERGGSTWQAHEWTDDELGEHYQAIDQARDALGDFRKSLQTPDVAVPPPPSPAPRTPK